MSPHYRWQRRLPPRLQDRLAGDTIVAGVILALLLAGFWVLSTAAGPTVPPGYAQGYADGQQMRARGLPAGDQAEHTCNWASSAKYLDTGELNPKGWDEGCLDGLQDNPRRD